MSVDEIHKGKTASFDVQRLNYVPAYRKVCEALENLIYGGELKPGAKFCTKCGAKI